jgi:hypothetical protein
MMCAGVFPALPGVRAILVLPAGCQRMILPAGHPNISSMT